MCLLGVLQKNRALCTKQDSEVPVQTFRKDRLFEPLDNLPSDDSGNKNLNNEQRFRSFLSLLSLCSLIRLQSVGIAGMMLISFAVPFSEMETLLPRENSVPLE